MSLGLFRIGVRDLIKGVIVACFSAMTSFVVSSLETMLQTQTFHLTRIQLLSIPVVGVSAGLGYLLKQFLTDEQGKIGGKVQL